jgi:hypothetical protein
MNDKLNISCVGWQDISTSMPLLYTFYINDLILIQDSVKNNV